MVDDPKTPSAEADDVTVFRSAAADGATFQPGALVSHTYRIERLLARGGMGEVYRAQHAELGTWHALKIILPELAANPKIVDLFRREGGILRNLRSDAVVAYDGVFRDETGRVYLVMEYVDGPSLSQILARRKLTPTEVRRLRDRVAAGLAAAHEIGVVHRDMSPDNIILPGGKIEAAKIIDFGIAKLADPEQKTILGDDFAGKYAYVSPEQLGMHGGAVDARSDIYSLGLILVAAAIGRPLDMGNSMASVLQARGAVPDLSEVPDELLDELVAMLQPDPAKRPQTMRELNSDSAGTALRGPPPGAKTDAASRSAAGPAGERAQAASRARPLALILGASLAVVAALAYGGYALFPTPAPEEASPETPATTADGGTGTAASSSAPALPPATSRPMAMAVPESAPAVEQPMPRVMTPAPSVPPAAPAPSAPPAAPAVPATQVLDLRSPVTPPVSPPASAGEVARQAVARALPEPTPAPPPAPTAAPPPPASAPANTPPAAEPPVTTAMIVPPPLPDPAARERAADQILRQVACGQVGGEVSRDGAVRLLGHVPSDVERQVLRALLLGVDGIAKVDDSGLVVLTDPNCRVVEALPATGLLLAAEQRAEAEPLGRPSQAGTLSFRAGELLTIDLIAPPQPTYYYVDYYDNANNVIHLLPSPDAPDNKLQARQAIRLGGTERYAISPPFGLDLVIAVGASVPLFPVPRPEVEPADAYLKALIDAVAGARGAAPAFHGEYSYLFVETKP